MTAATLWKRYLEHRYDFPDLALSLDLSRMNFSTRYLASMEEDLQSAYEALERIEQGAKANHSENRMVGHYWLRNEALVPSKCAEFASEIRHTRKRLLKFARAVRRGKVTPPTAKRFKHVLLIGIGGSALGPQLVSAALGDTGKKNGLKLHFLDNTDPDGMTRVLTALKGKLKQTLTVVISKSGGTPETRNGMRVARAAYEREGLSFRKHAVAVTEFSEKSALYVEATKPGKEWLTKFPMWDFVGGRTSVSSAVGLLPAALEGIAVEQMLAGMAACDEVTRRKVTKENPAALLAAMWYYATKKARPRKCNMAVLPYKDRLELFSRYLQQLIMESLGKEEDRAGEVVEEGLTVFGNKGSTDQHAFVQQLRDGRNDFFVTFIEVLEHGGDVAEVEPGVSAGDYLHAFLQGTRKALSEKGRESITITLPRVEAFYLGVLIALFERAVGLYAELANLNAYDQPGVEAGKTAAAEVLVVREAVIYGAATSAEPRPLEELAELAKGSLNEWITAENEKPKNAKTKQRPLYEDAGDLLELVAKQIDYLRANHPEMADRLPDYQKA